MVKRVGESDKLEAKRREEPLQPAYRRKRDTLLKITQWIKINTMKRKKQVFKRILFDIRIPLS
jgi:hypothetical protein